MSSTLFKCNRFTVILVLYYHAVSLITFQVASLSTTCPYTTCCDGGGKSAATVRTTQTTTFVLPIDHEKRLDIAKRNRIKTEISHLQFDYEYYELILNTNPIIDSGKAADIKKSNEGSQITESTNKSQITKVVLLIHPIGVGIGRWYYNRLVQEMTSIYNESFTGNDNSPTNLVLLVPDLLGCGSASNPKGLSIENNNNIESRNEFQLHKMPLLTIDDWSDQLMDLMARYEDDLGNKNNIGNEINWCIVSNGGCVPIALELGKRYRQSQGGSSSSRTNTINQKITFNHPITNLILSATPSSDSLFSEPNHNKIKRSYNILSGLLGSIFWWNALRSNGKFIQKFSEKNLASRVENLGADWTPTCVETARAYNGMSRFSTFAFLAGSLNGGSSDRFRALASREGEKKNVKIDIITGGDVRRNPARSWFWEKQAKRRSDTKDDKNEVKKTTLVPILKQNGNLGKEYFVGGRRCPAHEDAIGFAKALVEILT